LHYTITGAATALQVLLWLVLMILYYQENVARDADARLLVRLTREVTRETAGETDTADAAAEDFEAAVEAAGKDAEENRKYSLLSKLRTFCRKTCYRCGETHCSRSGCHVRGMDIFQENLPSIWIIPVRMVISVLLLYCPVFAVSLFSRALEVSWGPLSRTSLWVSM